MAINPNIALSGGWKQDPFSAYLEGKQIKRNNQLADLQMKQYEQQSERQNQLAELLPQVAQGNDQAYQQGLAIDPKMTMQVRNAWQQMDEAQKAKAREIYERGTSILSDFVKVPEGQRAQFYPQVAAGLARVGFTDVPDQYDPGWVQGQLAEAGVLGQVINEKQDAALKRQQVALRSDELAARNSDRDLDREMAELRRDELRTKIAGMKKERAQESRDVEYQQGETIANVENTIDTIDRLLEGNALEKAAGFEANFPTVAGSKAANFEAIFETLQSQAFLSEIEKMKGMGALSENEGKKLANAIGALDIRMGDKALRAELKRIQTQLNEARSRLQQKFGNAPKASDNDAIIEDLVNKYANP